MERKENKRTAKALHTILLLNSNNYRQVCLFLMNKLHVRNISSLWLKREWEATKTTPKKTSVTACLTLHLCFIWGLRRQAMIMMTMTSNGKTPSTRNDIPLDSCSGSCGGGRDNRNRLNKETIYSKDCLLYRLVMHRDCLDSLMMEGNSHSFTAGFTSEDEEMHPKKDSKETEGIRNNTRVIWTLNYSITQSHPTHLSLCLCVPRVYV